MGCRHNYWYSQGAFRCKKCGHVSYKDYRRNNKRNGAIIGIVSSAIVIFFFVGLPYINPNIQIPNQSGQIQLPKFSELPKIMPAYTKPLLAKISSLSANLSQVASNSNIQVTPPPSLDQLQQFTVNDLNKYRQENNVTSLTMMNEPPSQIYAQLLLSERCLHHMNDNGTTPQGRFHNAGIDSFAIGENIAGGQKAVLQDLEGFIKSENNDMMFNDASSNWGHRQNILDPTYASVSIGVAYDATNMVIVEDFESPLQGNEYVPTSAYYEIPDSKECW